MSDLINGSKPGLPRVRVLAQGRWRPILRAVGIDEGALRGRHCPCPMCGGKDRFRFDDKEGRGTYFCAQCGPGDGMQLVMHYTGLGFPEAARKVELLASSAVPVLPRAAQSDDQKRGLLRRVFTESRPIQHGDEVSRYLRARGLRLDELPDGLRLHPDLLYRDGDTACRYPAMLALVTGPDGGGASLHRTYLQAGNKAPITNPKRLLPGVAPTAGAAIRLTPASTCLGIAEGIESALAVRELFDSPTWSALNAHGITSFEPPDGVRKVLIFADNDRNFVGQRAAYAGAERLASRGYEVEVFVPPTPGDWLDELNRRNARSGAGGE